MRNREHVHAPLLLGVLISLAGCGDEGSSANPAPGTPPVTTAPGASEPLPEGVFESAHPAGDNAVVTVTNPDGTVTTAPVSQGAGASTPGSTPSPNGGVDTVADGAPGSVGAPPSESPRDPAGETDEEGSGMVAAARAIEEADVIKLHGDRLYALSTYGGLSVIDVSNPDELDLLGRYRSTATPFEMYVRDEVVFVLYNGYGEYEHDEETDSWTFYQTSYVMALNTENPAKITESERFEIPGYISDSRLIGDALYVVAFDDTYCYRCGDQPETNVMSLDVSNPSDIEQVDELSFEERMDEYSWRRSLSATDERLYIAGPRYGSGSEPEGSIIQVVDVSDHSGEMQPGDSLEVAGQINSRWQMDEYEGTLRVISQPMWWRDGTPPEVETFQIESSDSLVPLAKLPLQLPRPETLQSVRFDGPRGYAITFEQTDPLFTIDLSDPENPVQAGELEMPGWVYYMEPRGDRVIGLGFDQGNPEGSLTVSIFDVSELSEPSMLSRVNFGGDWAQLAEDQDRIHKSFQVLDDHELVLVPFSGHVWNETSNECGGTSTYTSGVQLIDWSDDSLALRGIAPSAGQARRSFFVQDRLLTMSDERLESFDIENRDAPKSMSKVDLAQIVNQVAALGDTVVRFGSSWWSDTTEIRVSSLDEMLAFEPGASLTFDDLNGYDCTSESYLSNIMAGGDSVYLMYHHYDWSGNGSKEQLKLRTLDVSDPQDPRVAGDSDLGFIPNYGRNHIPGMVDNGVPAVALDDALVFAEHGVEYNELGFIVKNEYTLEVVDMSDPDSPKRSSVAMPASLGSTGLLASGKVIATSHFETSPSNPNSVRFFLDRVDISDPGDPERLPSVNVPGSLLAYDHDNARALTLDYQYVTINDISPQQCHEEEFGSFVTPDPSVVDYVAARGPCAALRFTLHLVEIDGDSASLVGSYDVDKGVQITTAAIGEDRVFLGTGAASPYYYGDVAVGVPMPEPGISIGGAAPNGGFYIGYTSYPVTTSEARLLVASGLSAGELTVASTLLETTSNWYGFQGLVAKGNKAVVATGWQGQLSVIDASDPEEPVVRDSVELAGYVSDLDIAGNVAVAAMGTAGVQTIPLGDD